MGIAGRVLAIAVLLAQFYHISSNIPEYEKLGMDVILKIQGYRSAPLDVFMKIGSIFGFEFFFVLVPLLSWWGQDRQRKLGSTLFILLLGILFYVSILKIAFSRPRPFVINTLIKEFETAGKIEFSYPSGHACAASAFFFLATHMQSAVYWVIATLIAIYTVFSRVYFGVHYPHDIVAGVICGLLFLITFNALEQLLSSDGDKSKHKLFNLSNVFSISTLLAMAIVNLVLDSSLKAQQAGIAFAPYCLAGYLLSRPFVPKFCCESVKLRTFRVLFGVPMILSCYPLYVIAGGLKPLVAIWPGLWIFWLAPIAFQKLGLVSITPSQNWQENKLS